MVTLLKTILGEGSIDQGSAVWNSMSQKHSKLFSRFVTFSESLAGCGTYSHPDVRQSVRDSKYRIFNGHLTSLQLKV